MTVPATAPPAYEGEWASGKVFLVTGATSGIGRAVAFGLAERRATVIVGGRSEERCRDTVREITERTGNPNVAHAVADLASLTQVRTLASDVLRRFPRLDVLVNNAGGYNRFRELTEDGIERTWAVNYFAPFLLTLLLLPRLREGPASRVVNVASAAHRTVRPDWVDLLDTRRYRGFRAYSQTKLALLMFTYELARRLGPRSVAVNALHPGLVATRFSMNNPGAAAWLYRHVVPHIGLTPEQGARTCLYLACSPAVAGVSGSYFVRERPARSSTASHDREETARLWEFSMERTSAPPPPAEAILPTA